MEEIVVLVQRERVQQRTVDLPIEVVRLAPHGRVQQRTVEQFVDASQFQEETVEVERLFPPERVQQRINEQVVEVPLPQGTEDMVQRASHHELFFEDVLIFP